MKIKYLLIILISIFVINCSGDKVSKKQIINIILIYQDENKLKYFYENKDDIPKEEYWDAYDATYVNINIDEEYWYNIINKINKAKFSLTNLDIIAKRYKISQPIYTIKIKYEWDNETERKIDLWENLLNINNMWYKATNESKEIFPIIEEIINNHKIKEFIEDNKL
jgi:hypothetical protein